MTQAWARAMVPGVKPPLPALVLLLLASGGCENSCEHLCDSMATYARQCGYTVTDADIQTCKDGEAGKLSAGHRDTCRAQSDTAKMASDWGCDYLRPYFEAGGTDTASSP